MSLLEGIIDSRTNPLAVVEDIAADNNWSFERSGEDEVTIVSKGEWTDYQLSFTWMTEIEALHLACAFDMKVPAARRAEVQRLIAAINEQLWIGHFDIWTHTGMIMYRQALVLPGGLTASTAQCESMLVEAVRPPGSGSACRYMIMPVWVQMSKCPIHNCSLIAAISRCTSPRRAGGIFMSNAQARCSDSISAIQVKESW